MSQLTIGKLVRCLSTYAKHVDAAGNCTLPQPLLKEAIARLAVRSTSAREAGRKGGIARSANHTPEELSQMGKDAVNKRWARIKRIRRLR